MLSNLIRLSGCIVLAFGLLFSSGCDLDDSGGSSGPAEVRGQGTGFVWKPVSESDGNLVVLLPVPYNGGKVQVCYIEDSAGNILEVGTYRGDGNGNRPHYRFSKPGADYGNNLTVYAEVVATGELHFWPIPFGANRTEY